MGSWKDDAAERKRLEIRLAEEKRKQAQAEARQEEAAKALARQKEKAQTRRSQQAKEAAERERLREEARLAELKRKQAEARLAQMQKEMTDAKKAAEAKALTEQREKARQARMEAERRQREEAEAAQEAERQRQREEATRNAKHSLTIKTTPGNARIRILNIGPRYQDGLKLKPDRYDIEVSKEGYKRHREWIELESRDMVHLVDLDKIEKKTSYSNSYSSGGSHSAGDPWTDPVTGMEFMWVAKGCFQMGSPSSEEDRSSNEKQHWVCLSNGYWLGKYEVTQGQWEKVMGNNPSSFKGRRNPVEQVSWNDVQKFIEKLNSRSGETFRLPTEAEWEYAARAGTTTPFSFGNTISTEQVNYDGNYPYGNGRKGEYREKTVPVGSLPANRWGFHEMHGNVWEWVQDWYGDYPSDSVTDPTGARSGSDRVYRGGSWSDFALYCRSAIRIRSKPGIRIDNLGFRLSRAR